MRKLHSDQSHTLDLGHLQRFLAFSQWRKDMDPNLFINLCFANGKVRLPAADGGGMPSAEQILDYTCQTGSSLKLEVLVPRLLKVSVFKDFIVWKAAKGHPVLLTAEPFGKK